MDDPWADTPSTPQPNGTPRASVEIPAPKSSTSQKNEQLQSSAELEDTVQAVNDSPKSDTPTSPNPAPMPDEVEDEGFDDFDDFDAPDAGPSFSVPAGEDGDGDGFGDFGDFEEGDFTEEPVADESGAMNGSVEDTRKWVCLPLQEESG
jgi:hypothetical protein